MAVTPPEAAVSPAADPALLCNRPFAQIAVGDVAAMERTLSLDDIQLLALLYGDLPQQLGPAAAGSTDFHGVIGHGMWAAALISSLLGTRLPGPGTIYQAQTLQFRMPLQIGDTLQMRVQVRALDEVSRRITLACIGTNQHGAVVIEGEADVIAPDNPIERPRASLPTLRLLDGGEQSLCERAQQLGRIRVAVVHPCDATSLAAALDARAAGLIEPLLVAPRTKLEDVAREAGLDLSGLVIEDVEHSHAAAARAAALAASGQVEALMKGSLHTDELMAAVVRTEAGLRTARRISHCYLMHTPAYPRPFIITDAAINIAPTLEDKADIVRNAIALAHLVGVAMPRVAILAAVETVNPHMPATLDAAVLCKMAERGQITGAVLDGPLAFDNAISAAAARIKGIVSPVAGRADILVVPDLESGNMLAKQLEYLGGAASAGIVMGARVPIVLTSRADSRESRVASCALASLVAHHYRTSPP
ncbi:bifunctional enoyl-CoA hydratase/phosphate acetyltransferase [Rhodanobacter glycinis]|uniref:bifunctional enoyl-CoA hydratase/phosphate acetyltransferase n=1 Tax=Rhodanobacter glycinis TaxID=582702 RepID=UPI001126C70F|nr:bifunctional enoyl-CoA hydratase/phosphate acetyltransferase [Rhodanobacter glycinis]TPG50506.1 bifunctional enoyl-CoA hydratase/phosphate acetyltransferase [Rhodanobacter glycinis]